MDNKIISNDAEELVTIIEGKRYYNGKYLSPSTMLWRCTNPECNTPPRPQRRLQYQDKLLCNKCKNQKIAKDPEVLKRRGEAISKAISQLGDQWSQTAQKNMSNKKTRQKISKSLKKYINENQEIALTVRKETAENNNKTSGFGTSEFTKKYWSHLTPEERLIRIKNSKDQSVIREQEEHVKLVKKRYPDFKIINFGHPNNLYECPNGHQFLMRSNNFIKRANCPVCSPKSQQQLDLYQWILTILPGAEQNRRVLYLTDEKNGNKALEIDIFDKEKNFGIEVHGLYYHQKNFVGNVHKIKSDLANKYGITLLQFFEDEIKNSHDLVQSIIKSKLGIFTKKIYARKCEIVFLNKKECSLFLDENHLQGRCNSLVRLGLKYQNELISVLTFRKPRNKPENQIEIARFCNKMNTSVIGGFSKMLKKAENLFKSQGFETIVTYADRRYSNGQIYKNNNFLFKHFTVPDMFWVKGEERYPRQISWGKTRQQMLKDGYFIILGAGNSYWEKHI